MPAQINFREILDSGKLVLTEAAVLEVLRRDPAIALHAALEHSLLIYDAAGRVALENVHGRYIELAQKANLPIVISAPTWRANPERRNLWAPERVNLNENAVALMKAIRSGYGTYAKNIYVAGLLGCRGDAYRPEESLSVEASEHFHQSQIQELADAGVDLLLAVTLPALEEAEGIAKAMKRVNIPAIISFVIAPNGCLLDGHTLEQAITRIDSVAGPDGYGINCAHPDFYDFDRVPPEVRSRIVWYQGNGSACDQMHLDKSESLLVDDIHHWARRSARLHKEGGIQIIGGCCGTDERHLHALLEEISIFKA